MLQTAKFAVVSGISTGTDYVVLGGMLHLLPANARLSILAVAFGYMAGVLMHFCLTRQYVFAPSPHSPRVEFLLVVFIGLIGLGLTEGIVYWGMSYFNLPIFLAKTLAVLLVFGWNFQARRRWVYREPDDQQMADRTTEVFRASKK
ncbi:MAG TPA: GtrA family protein [Armatimonadota bacterium]|nr:GtrA family protein [Armatimonadota bacterium]